jgi:hypothetical protein
MPAGTTITFGDQDNFYCVARQEDVKCWRVSKADQNDWAHITIPRIFRNTDYAAISAAVLDAVKAKDNVIRVRAARVELDSNGSLIAMELDILRYKSVTLQMKTWDSHQQVRARRSRYPSPEEGKITNDITCNQMKSSDSKCPRNPIQSESNPNPNPNPSRGSAHEEKTPNGFDRFWEAYPRKTAKQEAIKAFEKLKPDAMLIETMVKAIERQKQSAQWQEDGGRYIPHPATWINQRRWEDVLPAKGPEKLKVVNAAKYDQREYHESDFEENDQALLREAAMM